MQESSTKPYLIRALHEWCTDNGYTPHIVVTVDANTIVPPAHIHDGQITLNIGTLATNRLTLGNDYIEFQTRFGGITEQIFVPVAAVSAIYARETGAGMGFEVAESQPYPGGDSGDGAGSGPKAVVDAAATPAGGKPAPGDGAPPKPPRLKIVK
ncbi:ClpXP protease specificity-enhancing factor [Pollutimonas bauzanensis]|uniref:Stringent starvation protein B n=1 Tax=Pollutimonas bauzanensis TaxID=658167 RepID=A0A1M5V3N9_9BURK|nr:ClpXP protease specificity-enhancing factor [Pollutimonas bauzanensis]SHH69573.1 stringent starvation protein B [Pollutimonas bauzanensis]